MIHYEAKSITLQSIRSNKGIFYIDGAYHPKYTTDFPATIKDVDEELIQLEKNPNNTKPLELRANEIPKITHTTTWCEMVNGIPKKTENSKELISEEAFENFCSEILAAKYLRKNKYKNIEIIHTNNYEAPDIKANKNNTTILFEVKCKRVDKNTEIINTHHANNPGIESIRLIDINIDNYQWLEEWIKKMWQCTKSKAQKYNEENHTNSDYKLMIDFDPTLETKSTKIDDLIEIPSDISYIQFSGMGAQLKT